MKTFKKIIIYMQKMFSISFNDLEQQSACTVKPLTVKKYLFFSEICCRQSFAG